MPPPTALGPVMWRFACPTNWWASCLNSDNCQRKVSSDVISGVAFQYVGPVVCVECGDSGSIRSRDIRLRHSVTEERRTNNDAGVRRSSHQAKTPKNHHTNCHSLSRESASVCPFHASVFLCFRRSNDTTDNGSRHNTGNGCS